MNHEAGADGTLIPGQMGDLYASPADPVFYRKSTVVEPSVQLILTDHDAVHHANLDRVLVVLAGSELVCTTLGYLRSDLPDGL